MSGLKKILLTVLLFLMTMSSVYASQVEVSVNVNPSDVQVTATSDELFPAGLSLKVFKLRENEGEYEIDLLTHVYQTNAYTENNGVYTYTFDQFGVAQNSSGVYKAVVGGQYEKDFVVVSLADKITFYQNLDGADETEIYGILEAAQINKVLTFDIGNYFSYNEVVRQAADLKLSELDIPDLAVDATAEDVAACETAILPLIKDIIAIGDVLSATKDNFDSILGKYTSIFNLDYVFYNDEVLQLSHEAVYNEFVNTQKEYAIGDVINTFDNSVLITIAKSCDYGTLLSALSHYDGKCITLNNTYYSRLTETLKQEVGILLKGISNQLSVDNIADKFFDCSKQVYDNSRNNTPPAENSRPGKVTNPVQIPVSAPVVEQQSKKTEFSDIDSVSWAKESIEYLADKKIIQGKAEKLFYPNDNIKREEFIKIIVEAFELYDEKAQVDFSDVDKDRWSYAYISSAYNLGIVSGVSDSTFAPSSEITREQMAAIVYRVYNLLGENTKSQKSFADDNEVSLWAKEAVSALAGSGVINGTGDNKFSPKQIVTRAQSAKIIYEMLMLREGDK